MRERERGEEREKGRMQTGNELLLMVVNLKKLTRKNNENWKNAFLFSLKLMTFNRQSTCLFESVTEWNQKKFS